MIRIRARQRWTQKLSLTAASILIILLPHSTAASASPTSQTTAIPTQQSAPSEPPQFDVASLRPISPDAPSNPTSNINLDASDFETYTGGLIAANGYLINYIIFAYKITDTTQYPKIDAQLPPWAHTEQFHLEARPDGAPTIDRVRLMVQSLLKQRFHLALHQETRQLPIYALVLDKPNKPGPGLTPSSPDGPCSSHPQSAAAAQAAKPTYCAPIFLREPDGITHMRILGWTMQQIAGDLATTGANMGGLSPRPIVDKTGLPGSFDINIDFVRESRTPQPANSPSAQVVGLSFTGALMKQAGLRLIKEQGPVNVMIIDHVDELTGN